MDAGGFIFADTPPISFHAREKGILGGSRIGSSWLAGDRAGADGADGDEVDDLTHAHGREEGWNSRCEIARGHREKGKKKKK